MNRIINVTIKLATLLTFGSLFFIVSYIFLRGIPALDPKLFQIKYTSENLSLLPSIINTLAIIILTLIIATPIGVFTSFYLVEYANKKGLLVGIIRITTQTLSGIPSIVYGLFGMLFFVIELGFKYSVLAGTFTLSIMILPIIINSTEEALLSIDDSMRMGSFALGAGKVRTIFKVILPICINSILAGVILSIGRIVGETAALIYTLGTASKIASGLFSSGRTLALHMYLLSTEGAHVEESYATGVVLLLIVFGINGFSTYIGKRLGGIKR